MWLRPGGAHARSACPAGPGDGADVPNVLTGHRTLGTGPGFFLPEARLHWVEQHLSSSMSLARPPHRALVQPSPAAGLLQASRRALTPQSPRSRHKMPMEKSQVPPRPASAF